MPAITPVTTPEDEPTEAMGMLALTHVPPVVRLFKVVVSPAHTLVVPVMAAGNGFTVTVFIAAALPQLLVIV